MKIVHVATIGGEFFCCDDLWANTGLIWVFIIVSIQNLIENNHRMEQVEAHAYSPIRVLSVPATFDVGSDDDSLGSRRNTLGVTLYEVLWVIKLLSAISSRYFTIARPLFIRIAASDIDRCSDCRVSVTFDVFTQRSSYRVTPNGFLRLPRPSSRSTSNVAETLQAQHGKVCYSEISRVHSESLLPPAACKPSSHSDNRSSWIGPSTRLVQELEPSAHSKINIRWLDWRSCTRWR